MNAEYRVEVDGLRALAIIPVVLFHAGISSFRGGFVGVDVFFVISGYLITRLLIQDIAAGRFSIIAFYERRARRILPALFVVTLCCVPFAWLWMLPSQMAKFGDSMTAVAGFASNILFWRQDGYFDEAAEFKPLLHTWSLAVEEQFYILFPPALYVIQKLGRKKAVGTLCVAAVASLLLCEWGWRTAPAATFYLAPTRAWELLGGSLCAFYPVHLAGRKRDGLAIAGLLAVAWSMTSFDATTPYPSAYTLVPVVGTMLIIQFAQKGTFVASVLSVPLFVWIGLISYSTYLWHQPLFAFARLATPGAPTMTVMLFLASASFFLGYLSWRFVEQPFRRTDRRWCSTRRQMLGVSALGMLLVGGIGFLLSAQKGFVAWVDTKPLAYLEYSGKNLEFRPCTAPMLTHANLTYCRLPSSGLPTAALIGDSHAEDKFSGLNSEDPTRRWILLANSSCPPVLNVDVISDERSCAAKMDAAINYVLGQPNIRTVALSFLGSYPLTTSYAADHFKNRFGPEKMRISSRRYPQLPRDQLFEQGLTDAVEKLVTGGKDVIIFVDQPELPFLPLDCIKGAQGCIVPMAQVLNRQALHRSQLNEIRRVMPSVRVFDPLPSLCSRAACSYKLGGEVIYRDSHHLSLVGSERFAKAFLNWSRQNSPIQPDQ